MSRILTLDQQPGSHAGLVLVLLPLTLWQSYSFIGDNLLEYSSGSKPRLSTLLLHGAIVALLSKVLFSSISKFNFYRRARSLGCGAVTVYPHKEPLFGLDLLVEAVPKLKTHTTIQWITGRLARHGTHFYRVLGGEWIILTDEPENVKAMLGTKMDDFPIGGPRLLGALPILGPNSIFTTTGDAWRHNRAVLRPAFVRNQMADLACFDKHISNMIRKMPTDGSAFDLQALLQDMTMDASTDFLFGYPSNMLTDKPTPGADTFIKAFAYASAECAKMVRINPILLKLPHPTLDANVKIEREFMRFYIRQAEADRKERIAKGEPKKRSYVFLDELLGQGHSEEYLVDQLLAVMLAGRDATAMGIATAVWFLARNPEMVKKLRREILGLGVQDPTWEQLKDMKYLNNIIKEGLRLVPPVPTNSRTAAKETLLPRGGGPDGKQPILVRKGQSVRYSTHSMHRRKDIYGPDADEFRPERWEVEGFRPGWEYIPFSGGPRICIGQQFALTQISLSLFRIFQAFSAVEARDDDDELRLAPSLAVTFALGCHVAMTPA